ncbi:hypothetical protein WOLCODRAFT_137711 [Wolfiporia cocos MD-104 SS10]|uniref:Xylanolytic transcriptional activator regulatory domain-containing protein n=1 Tax=Wolfiporia cocos (strain MD-104) TaxID=742152 RepID=A0A2H3JWA0_WOLCO|nr:hypothetical protein WOLCODRAFT_137711 [Wolfiporia cocos MD-104 SS10]
MSSPLSQRLRCGTDPPCPITAEFLDLSPGLTLVTVRVLLCHFLLNADKAGFFLDRERFLHTLSSTDACAQLGFSLINAICLWGARFSTDETLRAHEARFLASAAQAHVQDLARDHLHHLLHSIQAAVLLANYFFAMGCILKGRYYCNAAVAVSRVLQMRCDAGSSEERDALCAVFTADILWSAALSLPSHVDIPQCLQSRRSVLEYTIANDHVDRTFFELRTKAASLLERVSRFASSTGNPTIGQDNAAFDSLHIALDQMMAMLPPVERTTDHRVLNELVTIHTITHVAQIKLYSSSACTGKVLEAALASVALLQFTGGVLVSPIMAPLWTTIAHTLNTLQRKLHCRIVVEALAQLLTTMNLYAHTYPLMTKHLHTLQ